MSDAQSSKRPLQVFFSYAHADEKLRDELAKQLDILERQGNIATWHDRRIKPGEKWAGKIAENLKIADLILLLVSADFLASDYIQDIELQTALAQHQDNKARVIPIILRPCLWRESKLAQLQALPTDGEPITSNAWPNQDTAWLNVVEGILRIAQEHSEHIQNKLEPTKLIWNIPYRQNPYFTGRKALLKILRQKLATKHTTALTQTQAITGLGGIGKTQTAIEYAYRHRKDYRVTWWLHAEEPATLAADYAKLAIELDLLEHEATEQAIQIQAVRNWLEQHSDWLLIFDNAEERHDIRHYVPQTGNGHVLITSRNPIWDGLGTTLSIEVMQPEEALAFLAKRTDDPNPQAAATLAKTLGYLPLALEQAAAYIRETSISLDNYQTLFQKHHAQLLQDGRLFTGYPDTVATTWELSFQKVQKAAPAAADFLNLCAFLAPDAILLDMITEGATYVPKRLAETITNPLTLNKLIGSLLHYSLLQREGNTLTLHRLVQSVLRDRLKPAAQRRWAERAVQIVNQAFPAPKFTTWPRCEQLLPHAQICTRWIQKWEFIFEEAGQLLSKMSLYLDDHAAYTEAELLYQQARAIKEKALGPNHSSLAITLNNLALLHAHQGHYAEAEPLYQQALAIHEKALEPDRLSLASTLSNLALLYKSQGRYAEAELLYQQALTITEKVLGPNHPELATTLNNLANLYGSQGRYAKAEPLYQRDLAITKKALGPDHPELATTLNNLANLYTEQDRYAEAESLYQQALTITKKAMGPDHPELSYTLGNLALLYADQGRYAEAEQLYQQAQAIKEKALGSDHPSLAITLHNLARLYTDQGRYAEAEPLYQKAQAIQEEALGPDHPSLATTLESYATLLHKTKRDIEATTLENRAQAIQVRHAEKNPTD